MDWLRYIAVLRRRMLVIVLTLGVTMAILFIGLSQTSPRFEATATLRLATATSGSVNSIDFEVGYAERLMNTYVEIAESRMMQRRLQEMYFLESLPEIDAQIVAGTELLTLTVEESNPETALVVAYGLTEELINLSAESDVDGSLSAAAILEERVAMAEKELTEAQIFLEQLVVDNGTTTQIDAAQRITELKQDVYLSLLSQYELVRAREVVQTNLLTVIQPAAAIARPSSPNIPLLVGLGLIFGLLGGIALAFVIEGFDKTIYSAGEAAALLSRPALGLIPTSDHPLEQSLFAGGRSLTSDAFRRLAFNIESQLGLAVVSPTILITSAEPREGKSTVASNLAQTFSQQGKRVLLIDVDLVRPTLHDVYEVDNQVGLCDVLSKEVTLDEAVKIVEGGVTLLPSGSAENHSAAMLTALNLQPLLNVARRQFDVILIDGPPLLSISDATAVVPQADAVLLVVACNRSNRSALLEVREQLALAGNRPIHLVVNYVDSGSRAADFYINEPPLLIDHGPTATSKKEHTI